MTIHYLRHKIFLSSFLLICGIAVSAQNEVKLKFTSSKTYAGIEVGSKGVKMSVIEVSKKNKKGSSFQTLKDTSINSDFISFSPTSFYATLNAMQTLFEKAFKQYEIPSEKIFTVISSGVKGQADKEDKTAWINNLADSFKLRVSEPNRKIDIIDVAEEARLSHLGIVPEERRYNTFLIDIGSGNSKGGYFPNGNTKDLKLFQLNWGTKSTNNAVEKRSENDKTIQNYQKQLNRVLAGAVNSDVVYAVNESGAYSMNDYVVFSGGIAWSIATLLYPELIDNSVVPVTYEEVEKLFDNLHKKYLSLSDEALIKNLADKSLDKTKISKEIKSVHQVFDQKSLMAGVGLLLKIMRQFQGIYERKEFYLVKNGQVGWISAFVTEEVRK